jgi:hypothetical protein
MEQQPRSETQFQFFLRLTKLEDVGGGDMLAKWKAI